MKRIALLAYTAGIVDGEGCICLAKRHRRTVKRDYAIELYVQVGNTNEWLIQWLKMQFGGCISSNNRKSQPNKNWKPMWQWTIQHKQAGAFLELIIPFLQIKKPQAEIAIAFQKTKRRGNPIRTDGELAFQEAQRILMAKYNLRGKEKNG